MVSSFTTDINQGNIIAADGIIIFLKNESLKKEFEAAVAAMEKDESTGANPDKLATQICKIISKSSPAHSYLVGAIGQTIVPTLKAILPGSMFVKLMNDHYGIK